MNMFRQIGTCVWLLGVSGCGGQLSEVHSLDENHVFVNSDGTVIMKGFGGARSSHFVCLVPQNVYTFNATRTQRLSADVVDAGKGEASLEAKTENALAIAQTERLQALREAMTQLCFAYGNGMLGELPGASSPAPESETPAERSSRVAADTARDAATRKAYTDQLENRVAAFSAPISVEVKSGPSARQANPEVEGGAKPTPGEQTPAAQVVPAAPDAAPKPPAAPPKKAPPAPAQPKKPD